MPDPSPGTAPSTDLDALAGRLARAAGRLRRRLNRQVRAGLDQEPLPEAQLEILRLVNRRPGARVRDVAVELGLAANTVSTLVHRLTDAGLVDRLADAGDGRVARLRLRPVAELRLQRWRDRRGEILGARLAELSPADRQALSRALPVLERIVDALDEEAQTVAVPAPQASREETLGR
ncbi:MAG: MarR family transcriptional regulator [Candidatus Dormibacteria bacterium]